MDRSEEHDFLHTHAKRQVNHRVTLRVVALLAFAGTALVLPQLGPQRVALAATLVALIPVPPVLARIVPPRHAMSAQSAFDVVAAAITIWIAPDMWMAGMIIVVASPAASCALMGRAQYLALEVVGLTSFGAAAIYHDVPNSVGALAAAVILVPMIASYVDVFLAREQSATSQLMHVAKSADVILWEMDQTTRQLISHSGRVADILGYQDEEIPDNLADLVHPDDQTRVLSMAIEDLDKAPERFRIRHADGHWVWLRMSFRLARFGNYQTIRGVGVDITELVTLAETDELTGLPNRAVLNRHLDEELARNVPVTLLMMDLDRFKEVNDTLGHHSGDLYLKEIAERLEAIVADGQLVARLGGDEFALVDSSGAIDEANALAERAAAVCEKPIRLDGLEFAGSSSIGIAMAPRHGTTADDLLRHADLAMYDAKRSGASHRMYDESTPGATVDRLTLSSEIEAALQRRELRLWYQPKLDIQTGEIVGAESLLRWHHPERGVLRPKDFLDVIEISRHFPALTAELINQAIDTLAITADKPTLHISVNVSLRNLADPLFSDHTFEALSKVGVDPHRLILEITEREIMVERADIAAATKRLRDHGIGLSIDDFGTGHSSLLRLHLLPATELKIDRRFVSGLGSNDDARHIVRGVIDMARNLGHTVVAEGVERPYELEILKELGCDLGQGFLWSEAIPRDEFLALLNAPATPAALT